MVGFPRWIPAAMVYTGVEDAQYLSIFTLRKARRNPQVDPAKLGDTPLASELIASLYHSLLLQSPS